VFDAIWAWRFPLLLDWHDPASGASLQVRQALEPWPLICDTPREGGYTSRFVDGSMRRVELIANPALRERWQLRLQGRALPLPASDEPLAVRWREQRLYPCLHPGIAPLGPLVLAIEPRGSQGVEEPKSWSSHWSLEPGAPRFMPLARGAWAPAPPANGAGPWQHEREPDTCTVDLRQAHLKNSDHSPDASPP
jgi:hypothetical protein